MQFLFRKVDDMLQVKVTLREYIASLKTSEGMKEPSTRRRVPTMVALAKAAGVSGVAYRGFASGATVAINKHTLSATIQLLRDCGFDTRLCDIIQLVDVDKGTK